MYALLGEKQMPLPACVYHAVRKTFDLHKEELKSYTFERCWQCLKLYFISASILSIIYTVNTKYDVYMYTQVNIDLKIENVTLTKNVSV